MLKKQIEKIIKETAEESGYLIYDFSVYLKGENSKISVKLDSLEGISHADCENYSKILDEALEYEEVLANYVLEISSPGIKRKLRNIDDFIRFTGSPVKIIFEKDNIRDVVKGNIETIVEDKIEIKSGNKLVIIFYNDIREANLDY